MAVRSARLVAEVITVIQIAQTKYVAGKRDEDKTLRNR